MTIPRDDIIDIQELTNDLASYIHAKLDGHDHDICRNVLIGTFASMTYHHFDDYADIQEFFLRIIKGIGLLSECEKKDKDENE